MSRKDSTGGKKTPAYPLEHTIDELENLIADRGRLAKTDIPVLEDVIDPDLFDDNAEDDSFSDWLEAAGSDNDELADSHFSQEQIELLIGKMDARISGELDELVNILKDAIKDSIITEIKTQLESGRQDTPAPGQPPARGKGGEPGGKH